MMLQPEVAVFCNTTPVLPVSISVETVREEQMFAVEEALTKACFLRRPDITGEIRS